MWIRIHDTGSFHTSYLTELLQIMHCFGSGMIIPDPYFYPSRIQQQQQKRRRDKIFCLKLSLYLEISQSDNFFRVQKKFEPVDKELLS
jgi:hypothetical protein